jgi:hypothetical protein
LRSRTLTSPWRSRFFGFFGAGRKPPEIRRDEAIVWEFTTQLRRDHSVYDAIYEIPTPLETIFASDSLVLTFAKVPVEKECEC